MGLPTQVAKAEKQAEDMVAKLNQETDPSTPDNLADKPADPALPENQPEPETVDGLKSQISELQQQLRIWQGKYKAEIEPIKEDVTFVQRIKGEIKQMRNQVTDLMQSNDQKDQLIRDLKTQLDKPAETPAPEVPQDPTKVLSADEMAHLEREDLSGETLNIIWKLIHSAQQPTPAVAPDARIDDLTRRVDDVNQRISQNEQKSFLQRLKDAIPDLGKYFGESATPVFCNWLEDVAGPLDKRKRREILQEAYQNEDLNTIVKGINIFEESQKTPETNPPVPPPKDPLESQIEPNETIQGPQKPLGEQKRYRLADVEKFYMDQTKGLWKGREKEAAALSREFIRATQEGRIDQ